METLAACPLCGSPGLRGDGEKRDYVSGESFRVQTCLACGLGFVNPRPDREEIKAYYPSYYSWQEDGSGGSAPIAGGELRLPLDRVGER